MTRNRLVTGGSGLVGSCVPGDLKPTRSELDLMNYDAVLDYFNDNSVKEIVHCAAKVGGISANQRNMADFYRENVIINTNVLSAALATGVEKVMSFMSTCVFPAKASLPLTPEQLHAGEPHESNFGYAYAKRMLEVHSRAIRVQHGLQYQTIIPCNIYGADDNYSLTDGHVIPALIHKCYLAKKNNTPLRVWGTGNARREFMYASDAAAIATILMENYDGPGPLIVAPGTEYFISEIVDWIVEYMEFEGEVIYEGDPAMDGIDRKYSDVKPLHCLLRNDFEEWTGVPYKFVDIKTGLQSTIDYFVSHYDEVRK